MPHVLRVDAPDRIRRLSAGVNDGAYTWLAVLVGALALAGVIAEIIQIRGGSVIGALVCAVWVIGWSWATCWTLTTRRHIRRWQQPLHLGVQRVEDAHAAYWKLTPETRAAYGLPLIEAIYRLSAIHVEGSAGINKIVWAMYNRVNALKDLVDAEDKMRLYAADPTLGDNDDLTAAAEFQKAVEAAQRQLVTDDL